jgi:hypothetical protein
MRSKHHGATMCNALNHRLGCRCGFGGEGHQGGGRGAVTPGRGVARTIGIGQNSSESKRSSRWHNKTMSQLAAEIGHSIIFPVECWHCQCRIYLFADPNGGFQMFDDVGWPWPIHHCSRMPREPQAAYFFPPTRYSPRYCMPVPFDCQFADCKSGQTLSGAVVKVEMVSRDRSARRFVKRFYEIVLYNGLALFKIRTRIRLFVGNFVVGTPSQAHDVGFWLIHVKHLDN